MDTLKVLTGVQIPLAGGLTTRGDVYLPDDGARHPVLLSRTPYSRALTQLSLFNPLRAARRGYAVVISDCRGRFYGEGDFDPFENEAADGEVAIDWCSRQSWADGRVAMWGASYVGATQLLAATTKPSALRAIAPTFTAANYRTGWLLENDVVQQHFLQTWAGSLGATTHGVTSEARRDFAAFARGPAAFARPLEKAFGEDAAAAVPFYHRWLSQRDDTAYWDNLSVEGRYDGMSVAGLHIGGWYDAFVEGTLANFAGLVHHGPTEMVRQQQRLIVGPWEHALVEAVVGEVDFGPAAAPAVVDIAGKQLRFFDAVLNDTEPDMPRVHVFVMGADVWREFAQWPPPAVEATWFLDGHDPHSVRGDGRLQQTAPNSVAPWRVLFDPHRPVPSVGGRFIAPGARLAGPREQGTVEVRDDVLVFTSTPLAEPVTVIGSVSALIKSESSATTYDIAVTLTDVGEDGRSMNVVDGITRVHETGPHSTDVTLGSTAHRFERGHRIRVQVCGSNHPRLELSGTSPSITTIHPGQSRLILPVLEEDSK